jgi:hypothetical protein
MSKYRSKDLSSLFIDNDDYNSHDESMYYNDIQDMGAGSQVDVSLSQHRTDMLDSDTDFGAIEIDVEDTDNNNSTYHLLEPVFTQAINSIKSN